MIEQTGLLLYLFIFVTKMLSSLLENYRAILLCNNQRKEVAVVTFIYAMLYITVISTVLIGLSDDYLKLVVYLTATFLGAYLSSYIDSKTSSSKTMFFTITNDKNLDKELRRNGFGVTKLKGEGLKFDENILMIVANKKRSYLLNSIIGPKGFTFTESLDELEGGLIK